MTNLFNDILTEISKSSPEVAEQIKQELVAQRSRLKLIASENYNSLPVLAAGAALTMDKYSEGNVGKRYYSGCEQVDKIEQLAIDYAKQLFGAEYAYVQPHSGSDANLTAYYAIIDYLREIMPDKYSRDERPVLLSMDVSAGGHLTHSNPMNIVNELFDVVTYTVNDDGWLDYDYLRKLVIDTEPEVLLAGYSAYPRKLDFSKFREIADEVGAILMCDMAHFAGLVAGKVFTGVYNPVPYCDIVTSTTQKTLRAGRGGLILSKNYLADQVSRGCPRCSGGPLNNMIASKAVGFAEALKPEFREYANQVVKNCQVLADELKKTNIKLQTDGTDNHLIIINLTDLGINGRMAENALLECNIVTNRNSIPNDPNGAWYTSGLRIGTAALTTRGLKEDDMREVANCIGLVLHDIKPVKGSKVKYILSQDLKENTLNKVNEILEKYPLYPEIEL